MIAKQLLAASKAEFQVVMTAKQTDGVGLEETNFGSSLLKADLGGYAIAASSPRSCMLQNNITCLFGQP